MRKSKAEQPKTRAVAFCTFCNVEITSDHRIVSCPDCVGKVHFNGTKGQCTCCGRTFERQAPEPVVEAEAETEAKTTEE